MKRTLSVIAPVYPECLYGSSRWEVIVTTVILETGETFFETFLFSDETKARTFAKGV